MAYLVPNTYYTAQQFINQTEYSTPQVANFDENLIFPLVTKASDYQLAIAKADFPLDAIPLSRSNIPLKKYELVLQNGTAEGRAYLRQINASNLDYMYNSTSSGIISIYTYLPTGTLNLKSTTDLSSFVPNGVFNMCIDDYQNVYFSTKSNGSSNIDTLVVINISTSTVLNTLEFSLIVGMDLDRAQNLYIADESPSGTTIKVFQNLNSATEVILNLIYTIASDYNGDALHSIKTIAADNTLLVGYDKNKIALYSTSTFQPFAGFTDTSITQLGKASSVNSSGEGTFALTDITEIDELFIGNKAPGSGNLYDMVDDIAFGEPDFTLTANWKPTSKFAITDGFVYGVSNTNTLQEFDYDVVSGQPMSQATLVNNSFTFENATCAHHRNNVLVSTNSRALLGLNLNNLTANDCIPIDNEFDLSGATPKSFDFVPTSKKIIAIDSTTDDLHITNKPIYGKNFIITQPPNGSSTQTGIYLYGAGWNDQGQTTQTAKFIQGGVLGTYSTLSIFDQFQDSDLDMYYLANTGTQNVIIHTDINGTFVSAININNSTTIESFMRVRNDTVACMGFNGHIYVYTLSTGALLEDITTTYVSGLATDLAFICGGKINNTLYVICVSYGTKIGIIGSMDGYTTWSVYFAGDNFTPTGTTNVNNFMSGCLFGNGYTSTPKLILTASGNSTPDNRSVQSLVQFEFNSSWTNCTSSTLLVDDIAVTGIAGSVCWNWDQKEIYCQLGSDFETGSGELLVWNFTNSVITSTITIPNYLTFSYSPIANVICNGASNYYTWDAIITTGCTAFESIAVSRRNPNNIYAIEKATGVCFKGTLVANTIAFVAFSDVTTSTDWKSISVSEDGVVFDSFVKCFSISNQAQIGSTQHYAGKQVSSIARNDVSQNYSIGIKSTQINYFNSVDFVKLGTSTLPSTNLIFTKAGEDINGPNVDIYNMQAFVDSLNAAFAEAFVRLTGDSGTLSEAPFCVLDFQTQLFTLQFSTDYTKQGNSILFNDALLRIVQFYSKPSTVGFQKLILPTIPGSIFVTQTNKSAYKFNKLSKILIQSQTLYVQSSFSGKNTLNQNITDISVPTDTFINNLSQRVYFQPTVLRPYVIGSSNSIDRVQINLAYQYLDGSTFPLLINPDDGWSCLLNFIKQTM